jgi:hypothetical protein
LLFNAISNTNREDDRSIVLGLVNNCLASSLSVGVVLAICQYDNDFRSVRSSRSPRKLGLNVLEGWVWIS